MKKILPTSEASLDVKLFGPDQAAAVLETRAHIQVKFFLTI